MIRLIGVLKYRDEYFSHGIAPISYSWNCSQSHILQLQFPSKHEVGGLLMQNKQIRNNEVRRLQVFHSQFNSSSVYSVGAKEGEAMVSLQLAIEYP